MGKFNLSDSFKQLLQSIVDDNEFKKILYYMRCLKKSPHGGIFNNIHQCIFLKYYPIKTYTFLPKGNYVPYPVERYKDTVKELITKFSISIEELLAFCFCVDVDDNSVIFGKEYAGERFCTALTSGVLSIKSDTSHSFEDIISNAIDGKIKFTDYFNFDYSRLLDVFILWCVKYKLVEFSKIEDILAVEKLQDGYDKYGLSDITSASFERQGFLVDNQFFLYNIFFDTSIGSVNACIPKTIEILNKYLNADISIYMRKDNTLSVPADKKVTSATWDMQKWRGITLNLDELESQIKSDKEVTVHFDPKTMHKIITVIKPSETSNHEMYYHITVEQLWSPESIFSNEDVVLTNFIHGCYYPKNHSFDHVDFSVNQYGKELYLKKYQDSVSETSISIDHYSDNHYKVWCIKGEGISLQLWSELVICTLDTPFRKIFTEIIGAEIIEEE